MAGEPPAAGPDAGPASTGEIIHATNLSTCVLVFLVIVWSLGGHHLASRTPFLTEGSAACALGLITGLLLLIFHHYLSYGIIEQLLEFNAAGFFTYLLPPVIFYCGLSVEKSAFFANLPSILMAGVFGTLASFLIISIFLYGILGFTAFKLTDCLAMGAIFAATDSVATLSVLDRRTMPNLFSLVFGEGVINDAVSVVLLGALHTITTAAAASSEGSSSSGGSVAGGLVVTFIYLLVTSFCLGAGAGLGIALVLKKMQLSGSHQELALIGLLGYMSYLLADVLGLSGILSCFVCAILVSHYALHNVSREGRETTMNAFKTLSYLAEGMIFIYVGMDALDPLKWKTAYAAEALWLVLVLSALLAASRAAFVVPFSLLHNKWSAAKLSNRDIVIVWWSGLMRGAVSVALVYYYFDDAPNQVVDRQRATLIATTLMIVMLSILGCGALTKPLLSRLLADDPHRPLLDHFKAIPRITFEGFKSGGGADGLGLYMAPLVASERTSQADVTALLDGNSHTPQHATMAQRGLHGFSTYESPAQTASEILSMGAQVGDIQLQGSAVAATASDVSWLGDQAAAAAAGGGASADGRAEPRTPVLRALPPPPMWSGATYVGSDKGGLDRPVQRASGNVAAGTAGMRMDRGGDVGSLLGPLDPALGVADVEGGGRGAAGDGSLIEVTGQQPAMLQHIEQLWTSFDQRVMQPVFGGPGAQGSGAAGERGQPPSQQEQQPVLNGVGVSNTTAVAGGVGPLQPWVDSGEGSNL